jgi:hypothetical protein
MSIENIEQRNDSGTNMENCYCTTGSHVSGKANRVLRTAGILFNSRKLYTSPPAFDFDGKVLCITSGSIMPLLTLLRT